ncbi:Tetratricopeptide TPR_2 repeat-containing protein [Colwellia psychrerythraea]|uniref:Tetratricopeptide TPR_2 repeat-containing protein n=2 Tax=Colwellia psychrerythraea TaxID=28229 RepID=A0A099KDW7_COLPS|nr:Tetratricopeptide TPR_2 repeat-containing protein [Colwellia psychrerythraea]
MSLMTFLSTSSFFLSDYLTEQLEGNNYRIGQFNYALKSKNIAALTLAEDKADYGSMNWLALNQALAKSKKSSALELGYWYEQQDQYKSSTTLFNTAIMWFEQAIRLNSQQGVVTLAQLYFQQGKLSKAQATLQRLSVNINENHLVTTALVLRIKIAVALGNVDQVEKLIGSYVFNIADTNQIKSLFYDLKRYAVIKNKTLMKSNVRGNKSLQLSASLSCTTSLQLFATNLSHLKHLDQLIKAFKEKLPLAKYICLPAPRYISVKQLDCMTYSNKAINCDETKWQSIATEVDSRHIGLMLNKGGANVHLGILYFDIEDNVNVFSHEVSHLLGFVDEYPLRKGHKKCQRIQQRPFAHNIAVLQSYYQGEQQELRARILKEIPWSASIKADTPIMQRVYINSNMQKNWQLGTPIEFKQHVGLHFSESCQNSSFVNNLSSNITAFKPLSRRTQLRYFANDFPEEYLTLLEAKPSTYLMPSFHYNIALALFKQGNIVDAKYWLLQASKWENDPMKKSRIFKGAF